MTLPKGVASAAAGDFTTEYHYNANDWLVHADEPGATPGDPPRRTTITYNGNGTQASLTNPAEAVTTFTYNDNLSLRSKKAPAGTGDVAVTDYFYSHPYRGLFLPYPAK